MFCFAYLPGKSSFEVIFLGMLVEHRATLVFGRSTFQPAGYKAAFVTHMQSKETLDLQPQ